MQVVNLCYNTDKTLEIHLDTTDFFLDGKRGTFTSKQCRDFVVEVAKRAPKTAVFSELERALGLHYREDSKAKFRKLAYESRSSIGKIGCSIEIIESVKRLGYRLADGWQFTNSIADSRVHLAYSLLEELRTAVRTASDHVDKTPIHTNSVGLMYLERNHATQATAKTNYVLIEDVGWNLIHTLSVDGEGRGQVPNIIEIKKKIEKLTSYVLFWRIGDGLTEEKWRTDFRDESVAILEDIEVLIDRIVRSSAVSSQ